VCLELGALTLLGVGQNPQSEIGAVSILTVANTS
jgi:hypothetical protein